MARIPALSTAGPAPYPVGGLRTRRRSDRVLGIAIGVSLALHAILLSLRFTFPDAFKSTSAPPLEVVLVNSRSATRPDKPDVLAQANLDGGGNTDDNRRAKTPLPAMQRSEAGSDAAAKARARVQELEQQQQQLLTRLQQNEAKVNVPPEPPKPVPKQAEPVPEPPAPTDVSGQDLAARALAMARLEAQIARQIEEYNKRPRKQFIGARAAEVRFAQYVEDWRQKIERVGNLNYPSDARGRIYGSLRVTVSIKSDGTVESIEIDRPSGYQVLDKAAERIVRLASPYAPFPAEIRKDTDILVITRTWIFAPGDKLQSE